MFLKNLKIYGFKTFGRKVVVDFQKGITAIVGPNGAGKSNLIDALNWVTGETKLSDLRVRTSEQLIFHGSPSLKPLSLAEVSLTIENTDNLLPIEYAEVNITRRIYRDGTSEFFINKNKCILKDITNLFLGTGAGRGAYASMRQGEIDRILKQKPEERREIFEEAAGILKYRNKRRETERDLERAEANLKQIRPTLIEVERQYQTKKKQAEKAERYNKLMDRRIAIEVDIHLVKVFDLKRELEAKNDILQKLLDKKQALLDKLKSIEMEIDASLAQSQDLQHNQHAIQTEILQHETEISTLRQRIASLGDRKMSLELNIKEWDAALLQSDQRLAKIDAIIEDLTREKSNLAGMIAERQDNLEQYARDITAIQKIVDDDAVNIETYRKKIADLEVALVEARDRLEEVINRMVEAIDKRKAELKGSAELKQDLKTSIARALDELGVFLKGRKDVLSDLSTLDFTRHSDKEKVRSTLTALRDSLEQRMSSVDQLRQQFAQLDNLISGFDEIIFAREGIHSQKESLDKAIVDMQRDEKAHKERIVFLETDIRNQQARIETIKQMMHDSQLALVQMREKSLAVDESMATQQGFRRDVEKQREGVLASITQARETISRIDVEVGGFEKEQAKAVAKQEKLKSDLARISKSLSTITQASSGKEKKARECKEQLEEFHGRTEEATRAITMIEVEMRTIYENFYENYSIDLREHEKEIRNRKFDIGEMRTELKKIKDELRDLGQVNAMAIDECRELDERYRLLKEQIDDIEKSQKNLESIIKEINKNSEELFHQTFNRIKVNFHKIFRRLFDGGKAELNLTNPENVLESGIEILVQPPSKALQNEALLSGGEASMTAIALLFAIFMVKPSPFCLLDEIDAALDGPNVERFKKMLLEFRETTQFLIISHNINTLKVADALYGISMEEDGVSTALSLDVNELEKLKKKYEVT